MPVDREMDKEDVACIHDGMLLQCCCSLVIKSCPMTHCSAMHYSLPGSSVHGISQARILEWVAMPSSRESS